MSEQAIAFLSDPKRIQAVLRRHESGPDVAAIHTRMDELAESKLTLDQARYYPLPGKPRITDDRYYALLESIEAEERELSRNTALGREASILIEALDFGDKAAEIWAERAIEWRRRILKLICTRVEVTPFRGLYVKGKRGGSALDPDRVQISFEG